MNDLKTIKSFMVDKAQYFVESQTGVTVSLVIDYKNNSYAIKSNTEVAPEEFEKEVSIIATDLLFRKHGKNFAAK